MNITTNHYIIQATKYKKINEYESIGTSLSKKHYQLVFRHRFYLLEIRVQKLRRPQSKQPEVMLNEF